jgi:hypothetical protein
MDKESGELNLVTVYTSMGPLRAEVIKSKLETVGIPVLLSYDSAGPVFGIIVDGMGEVRVQVPREFAAEALALIEPEEEEEDGVWDDEWEWEEDDEVEE